APALKGHNWTSASGKPFWSYQYLSDTRSPLLDYAAEEQDLLGICKQPLKKIKRLKVEKRYPEVLREYEKLFSEGFFNAALVYQYAQSLTDLNRFDEGLKQLKQVLLLDSDHSLALNDMGAIFLLKKDYSRAVEYFHGAIHADSHNFAAVENLIAILNNLGFKDYIIQFTRSLLARSSNDDRLKTILQKYNLPTWYSEFTLKQFKTPNWSLSAEFLREISDLFKADIFIETGTFLGGTTLEAARVFKSVYTIELSEDLYRQAQEGFAGRENIKSYQGDSGKLFPELLKTIKGKIVFWLDGHFSEGITAKSEKNSPILEELAAIKAAQISDAIILIDDLRMFPNSWTKLPERPSLREYPTITELLQALRDINQDYVFVVLGDILLAYPYCPNIIMSPVIASCTVSRLFDEADKDGTRLIEEERIIGRAVGEELAVLQKLFATTASPEMAGLGEHLRLWKALWLMAEQQYGQAVEVLESLIADGLDHWRLHWYLAQTAYRNEKMTLAWKAIQTVCLRVPEFTEAQELFKTWERKNDQIGNTETNA
ncbi:MAG: hypothetical protein C0407_09940, partial [Desulfobacca sp.]|nr:hypothetical protein [Desulfobacca sp.]